MQFAQPTWLIAGFAACALLLWLYRRFDRAQREALAQFAAVRLHGRLIASVSATRRRVKRVLFTLGILLLFVALARPQSGFVWQETHRKGLELLFAVDTSKSMLAQDIKPDRLTRAKLGVHDLVTKLNGDGVGLIAFAGSAFLQCPVTLDYDAFRESLSALDTHVIPNGGTNIAAAIREAEAVFKTRTTTEKILVLVTDGEDLDGEGITAAEHAAKNGVKIFTIGVGSSTGELVPVPDENGGTEFARDENGQLIRSHLDETTLKKIAEVTGGMYQPLGAQAEGLMKIYVEGLAKFTREDLSSRQAKVPLEKFYWPLLGALLCLLGEMLIGNRRRSMKAVKPVLPVVKTASRPALRHAALVLLCLGGAASTPAASPQSAEQAYDQGDFARAQQEYAGSAARQPNNASLHFNAGSAAYKAGDYAQATTRFQQSLKTDQVALQHDAYYNLGNTHYRIGQKTAKDKPETIKNWEEAVKSYDAALQIAANDTEAKHNRDFVQRKIDALKKQEEQKKQDQQKQDQKDPSQDQMQKQDQQKDSKDSKGGSQDQKQDNKDQSKDSKDSKGDANDSKSGGKDQPKDAKDQQSGSQSKQDDAKGQQDKPKDAKAGAQPKPGAARDQQAGAKSDESKEQQANPSPQSGTDKQEQQQADAKAGKDQQPKPVNAEKKPEPGKIEAANGDKPTAAQAAAAAAAEEERREPGQMTKAEARQLLDALKGDERQVPMISAQGRAAAQPNEHKNLKDW